MSAFSVSFFSALTMLLAGPDLPAADDQPAAALPNLNKLTDREKAAGWRLLFDGKTTRGWRSYKQKSISAGWRVVDGALSRVDSSASDIVYDEPFENCILELDTERPHAAPMDLSPDDRRRLRDLAGELDLPISAVSPNCDLSSPVPSRQEAVICYVRECIKLACALGAPICKIFAAWRGITLHDGIGSYDLTYSHDPYPFWKEDRRPFVVQAIRELAKVAGDCGIVLAVQNHGPDVVNNYRDTLALIAEVESPHFKACLDINIEDDPESEQRAWEMAAAAGTRQVHSHLNGEFAEDADGRIVRGEFVKPKIQDRVVSTVSEALLG